MITALRISSIVAIICLGICAFRDEGVGYVLSIAAAVLYLGLPIISQMVFSWQSVGISPATTAVIQGLQSLWWIYGVPGIIFVLVDMGRRFQAASENAAIQRANIKYGSNVNKQAPKGQRFLGRCWELPYCRDHVRATCPIYVRRRGPCWWYKEGCMCEERIVLQAVIAQDWKQQAAAATQKIGLTAPAADHKMGLSAAPPKQILTASAKRERCRKCIIYNEHQRQKYKLWVGIALVAVPAVLYLAQEALRTVAGFVLSKVEIVTQQFSLAPGQSDPTVLQANSEFLQNFLILILGIALLSQVLKLIEWVVLKLKL
jgi:hypothetical protein